MISMAKIINHAQPIMVINDLLPKLCTNPPKISYRPISTNINSNQLLSNHHHQPSLSIINHINISSFTIIDHQALPTTINLMNHQSTTPLNRMSDFCFETSTTSAFEASTIWFLQKSSFEKIVTHGLHSRHTSPPRAGGWCCRQTPGVHKSGGASGVVRNGSIGVKYSWFMINYLLDMMVS